MSEQVKTYCPLCNSGNTKFAFVKDSINYFDCPDCTFRFSKPAFNSNFHEDISGYEDAYIGYFDENKTDEYNHDLILKWIGSHIKLSGKNVLDIGCGSGKFVRFLNSKKINASGIEPSKPLFDKYLKSQPAFYNCTLPEFLETKEEPFDAVFALDVLEHIDKPKEFIEQIAKLQNPGGFLFLEIPLYKSFSSVVLGKRWHFYNKYHLSYFSKTTLEKLLKECGYTLVFAKFRGKYFNTGYIIRYISNFIFRKKVTGKFPFANSHMYLNTFDIYFACFKKTE